MAGSVASTDQSSSSGPASAPDPPTPHPCLKPPLSQPPRTSVPGGYGELLGRGPGTGVTACSSGMQAGPPQTPSGPAFQGHGPRVGLASGHAGTCLRLPTTLPGVSQEAAPGEQEPVRGRPPAPGPTWAVAHLCPPQRRLSGMCLGLAPCVCLLAQTRSISGRGPG